MRRSLSIALALVAVLGVGLAPSASAQPALNVAFLPKQVNNPYFDVAAKGGMRAAGELGGQFKQVGPSEATGAAQVPFIQDLTTQNVGAIVVSAADPDAIAPALKAARQAGIKVVGYDSSPAEGAYDVFVNQADTQGIGQGLVQMACDEAPNCAGDIAVLSATSTATNQNAWIDVMKQTLMQPQYAGLNLVDVVYGNDDDQTSQQQAQALLQSHPNLQVIVSPTTVGIAAAAKVLEDTGSAGTVQLTGLGTPNSLRAYVKDGTIKEFALWNVENLGYLAYYVAAKLISGDIKGNPGETFSVPTLGDYTIGENSVVVLGPPQVFTADNIDQFNF
ncbi:MAG: rhamnose ABC transporter substrate-binding protein [Chloroflexi bacterium]|nr:rhamnose ABC transporter substrate-binding protein [Chloroflexota bacterium]MBV9596485.1 rhamnose ABC transporter substrate-binding protein [Chloroflexota bacterium]